MYKVYGDYGYAGETLIAELDTLGEAISWAESYIRDGDFGGFSFIEVAWFAEDGEYVVERSYDAPELEPDFYY